MKPDIDSLRTIFDRMAKDGIGVETPLKWGFFFVDPEKSSLLKVHAELTDHDYHIEELFESDDGNWVLQVSKTEVLSIDKLHRRNIAFNALAEHCGVSLYDGWDVSSVES
ncbi:MAG TPA: ribonuclease E inhibitor RraB [Azospira sp.]|nr:ribonuclease E inhibitor RraB [Azospira sp.]